MGSLGFFMRTLLFWGGVEEHRIQNTPIFIHHGRCQRLHPENVDFPSLQTCRYRNVANYLVADIPRPSQNYKSAARSFCVLGSNDERWLGDAVAVSLRLNAPQRLLRYPYGVYIRPHAA